MTAPQQWSPDLQRALVELCGRGRILVASDFDGTMAPIVADPAAARALPDAVDALMRLGRTPGVTAVVLSGRSLADLSALSGGPADVVLVGTHGTEFPPGWGPRSQLSDAQRRLHAAVVAALQEIAEPVGGALVEVKPSGATLHYRNCTRPDAERVREQVEQGPARWDGVELLRGKQVVELSVVTGNKGSAIDHLRRVTNSDAVLFVGDDVTDETAFARLGPSDIAIKVGPGESLARYRVADPEAVAELLQELTRLRGC